MSIYNIALYTALAAVCGLFAAGLYQFALILLKVPSSRTTKAIKAVAARNRPSAAGFKNTYNDISLFVSRFIRLNEFKKKELADSLKIANISMSPELFTARALVRSAGIMLLSVPFFFFLPIIGLLVIVLAVLMYFQEKQKVDSCIKEKRKQIEFDLPRFVYAISQEIQMSHDVISILERHKDNFSPYLNEEIEITIADMRTGNYEAAIDVSVAVLVIMILLAGVIKIAPVFITKMTLNSYANELCREAEIAGRIGTETTARLDRLNESHPDLAPTVTWSASGNIQIGRTFSVTVSADYDFSFFVFNTAPITISATAEGTSEVFWK